MKTSKNDRQIPDWPYDKPNTDRFQGDPDKFDERMQEEADKLTPEEAEKLYGPQMTEEEDRVHR